MASFKYYQPWEKHFSSQLFWVFYLHYKFPNDEFEYLSFDPFHVLFLQLRVRDRFGLLRYRLNGRWPIDRLLCASDICYSASFQRRSGGIKPAAQKFLLTAVWANSCCSKSIVEFFRSCWLWDKVVSSRARVWGVLIYMPAHLITESKLWNQALPFIICTVTSPPYRIGSEQASQNS